jgi:hypothetical protein
MTLPSRLGETTLGDLLAALRRAHATGTLELIEPDRVHHLHLRSGAVQAVESSADPRRFGDLAVAAGLASRVAVESAWGVGRARGFRIGQSLVWRRVVSSSARDRVLDAQRLARLDSLYRVRDAALRFRSARALPEGTAEQAPLGAHETFHGRPRRRDHSRCAADPARVEALSTLGFEHDPGAAVLRRRFQELVLSLHPDRHPEDASRARVDRLRAVIAAYRLLRG